MHDIMPSLHRYAFTRNSLSTGIFGYRRSWQRLVQSLDSVRTVTDGPYSTSGLTVHQIHKFQITGAHIDLVDDEHDLQAKSEVGQIKELRDAEVHSSMHLTADMDDKKPTLESACLRTEDIDEKSTSNLCVGEKSQHVPDVWFEVSCYSGRVHIHTQPDGSKPAGVNFKREELTCQTQPLSSGQ